ncbi:MAG: ankyrin repeat domain-containing protein [Candidatus Moduliflexus flocculans]|nr:ankyrin repeat domain-containing protein [Candidatus Moduliflexus flocculans]
MAAEKGDAQMIAALLEGRGRVGSPGAGYSSQTPLYFAVKAEKPDALNALILRGADANAKFKSGQSALHEAVRAGRRSRFSAPSQGRRQRGPARLSGGRHTSFDAVTYDRVEVIPLLLAAGG